MGSTIPKGAQPTAIARDGLKSQPVSSRDVELVLLRSEISVTQDSARQSQLILRLKALEEKRERTAAAMERVVASIKADHSDTTLASPADLAQGCSAPGDRSRA